MLRNQKIQVLAMSEQISLHRDSVDNTADEMEILNNSSDEQKAVPVSIQCNDKAISPIESAERNDTLIKSFPHRNKRTAEIFEISNDVSESNGDRMSSKDTSPCNVNIDSDDGKLWQGGQDQGGVENILDLSRSKGNNNEKGSDSDDDESESDSDDDVNLQEPLHVSDDGRRLSTYEIQRLERIRRNKEYLAGLGLEEKKKNSDQQSKSHQRARRSEVNLVPTRTVISRRSKAKNIRYAEPSDSLRNILREKNEVSPDDAQNTMMEHPVDHQLSVNVDSSLKVCVDVVSSSLMEGEEYALKSIKNEADQEELEINQPNIEKRGRQKERAPSKRMEHFVYREFCRIRAHKSQVLKDAEKLVRAARKEIRLWTSKWEKWNLGIHRRQSQIERERKEKEHRQALIESVRKKVEYERSQLGSTRIRLLHDIDSRMHEILTAANEYDKMTKNHLIRDRNSESKEAEVFKNVMKRAEELLNTALVEKAQLGRSPQQKSTRQPIVDVKGTTRNIRKRTIVQGSNVSASNEYENYGASLQLLNEGRNMTVGVSSSKSKVARNAGGWISEAFSSVLDRSWLYKEIDSSDFSPSYYVPQVGDIILYYIAGHKMYLHSFPDTSPKKRPNFLPLWELAKQEKNELTTADIGERSDHLSWWNDEWLNGILFGDSGDYPIICRVEAAYPVFPPDPCKKGSQVEYQMQTSQNVPGLTTLPLEVTLRPLSSVLPPAIRNSEANLFSLTLPPSFSVITFPSTMDPFLIPFAWAYSYSHSLAVQQKVILHSPHAGEYIITNFAHLDKKYGTLRLENKTQQVRKILSRFDNASSMYSALEEELGEDLYRFFEKEVQVVVDVLFHHSITRNTSFEDAKISGEGNIGLFELIQSSLPIWKCVTLHHAKGGCLQLSPWDVLISSKTKFTPWVVGRIYFYIEDRLRKEVELTMESFVRQQEASQLFFYPVNENEAPNYYCVVPAGMCVSTILGRLKRDGRNKFGGCYYRGIESLLVDIQEIHENCLLYNDPKSAIVELASRFVSELKSKITSITLMYNSEIIHARNKSMPKNIAVNQPTDLITKIDEIPTTAVPTTSTIESPFEDTLNHDWPEVISQNPFQFRSEKFPCEPFNASIWVPQVGDEILYSPSLHQKFVNGHSASLHSFQCSIIHPDDPPTENSTNTESNWHGGTILWTRVTFPKSRSSDDNNPTFVSNSPLMTVCVRLKSLQHGRVLYWRPCCLPFDVKPESGLCQSCGVALSCSFLRLLKFDSLCSPRFDDTANKPGAFSTKRETFTSIDRCFTALRQRCVTGSALSDVRMNGAMTKAEFEELLNSDTHIFKCINHVLSVPLNQMSQTDYTIQIDPTVNTLAEVGYFPSWVLETGKINNAKLALCESFFPNRKLCLEYIHLRLREGFYRSKQAIECDLVDAFVASFFLRIGEALRRKNAPLSIHRVLNLGSSEAITLRTTPIGAIGSISQEEFVCAKILRNIREVYAAAIAIVRNTPNAEYVYGLPDETIEFTPNHLQEESRKKISNLVSAVGPDLQLNRFEPVNNPKVRIKVLCNKRVVRDNIVWKKFEETHAIASFNGAISKVKIFCNNEHFRMTTRHLVTLPKDNTNNECENSGTMALPVDCLSLDFSSCIQNEPLAKVMFGKPGRRNPCARCQVNGTSMLICRVKLGHSNPDYDWMANLSGVGGVDGLLHALRTGSCSDILTQEDESHEKLPLDNTQVTGENVTELDNSAQFDADSSVDPTECYMKANAASELATKLLSDAKKLSEAPIRFSKDFVTTFPIDEDDGHYVYCIICGLTGNLLCCDGCSNVAHSQCLGLKDVPEGEWFCEECVMSKNRRNFNAVCITAESVGEVKKPMHSEDFLKTDEQPLPFGRVNLDEKSFVIVSQMLDEIREKRLSTFSKAPNSNRERQGLHEPVEQLFKDEWTACTHTLPLEASPNKRKRPSSRIISVELPGVNPVTTLVPRSYLHPHRFCDTTIEERKCFLYCGRMRCDTTRIPERLRRKKKRKH